MTIHHTTMLSASELYARCQQLGIELVGCELPVSHLLDVLDLGIDRLDLSDLLSEYVDRGVDGEVELEVDDDWEEAFMEAVSAQ